MAARAQAEIEPRPRRPRRVSSAPRRNADAQSPVAATFGYFARRPTLARVPVGLTLLLAGFVAFPYLQPKASHDAPPAPQAVRSPAPTPTAVHKEARAAPEPSSAADDAEASAPAKAAVPTKPAALAKDPGLDTWFVNAYLRCWKPPSGLPQGEKYAAQIRVIHNPDGTLASPPKLVNPPFDPDWRAFADSAVRAAAKCPLQVPAAYLSHFDQWKKMTLHFSPDGAM